MTWPTSEEAQAELATYRTREAAALQKLEALRGQWTRKADSKRRALRAEIEHCQRLMWIVTQYLKGEKI